MSANARAAAQDKSTGAYLGEFNSGASAISIPILSDAHVPQISPSNTAVGLTSDEPGSDPGTPGKYYQSGFRNYARIVPKDTIQGAALATIMKKDGCTKVAMTNDKEVYGGGLAKNIELAAKAQGLNIIFNEGIDPKAANYRSLASKAKGRARTASCTRGITANNGVQIFKDFSAAIPSAKLYGPDGVAETGFTDPKQGGIPASVGKEGQADGRDAVAGTATGRPARSSSPTSPRRRARRTRTRTRSTATRRCALALDAITRSKTGTRDDIVKALFATKDRDSPLGTYSIDKNGDTTLTDYGVYKIVNGEQVFLETVHAAK